METFREKKLKILVIQTAFPGDAVLTLPMIQELKKLHENSIMDVLCIPSTKEIFESSPYVDSVIILDKKRKHRGFLSLLKFVIKLKENKYDKIYSPHRSFRTAIMVLMTGVADTYGFHNSSIPYVFKNVVNYDPSVHEVKRNLSLINFEFVNDNWKIIPEISVSESSKNKITGFKAENNLEKYITIAPGSIWATKKYPVDYYKQIIAYYLKAGFKVLLIGSSEERKLCEEVRTGSNIINAAGLFSITETIELLRGTKLLICNDSAPTHMGISADIPVLTIYCSTVPEFGFYPYNSESAFVSYNELYCKPCGIHGYDSCPLGTFDCAYRLQPEEIIKQADILLKMYER